MRTKKNVIYYLCLNHTLETELLLFETAVSTWGGWSLLMYMSMEHISDYYCFRERLLKI